ncbi:MAG TPA: choice-of-anchor Q domain-containing protein [Thermoleophilaceae bacterium]|nr:choice-of-anchor Q domain-containing protein [Thermoleophilaceae bacterium]
MLIRTTASIALIAGLLAVPSVAGAETVRVNGATGNNNGGNCGVTPQPACKTIQFGAARAQGIAGADQILVAPGSYAEVVSVQGQGDTLAGAGSCDQAATCTIIEPAPGVQDAVTSNVNNDNGQISGVRIKAATSMARIGLIMAGDNPVVRDVAVEMNAPNNTKAALRLSGAGDAVVDRTTVTVTGDGDGFSPLAGLNSVTVTDSSVKTGTDYAMLIGAGVGTVIRRSRFEAGVNANVVVSDDPGPVRLESSLIVGGNVGLAVGAPATVVGSTFDPGQAGGSDGTAISTFYADAGETSTVRDSLLVGGIYTSGGQPVDCSNSVVGSAGTLAPTCVAGTAGNSSADPAELFAGVAARDYRLKPGSPAVDAGSATALDPAEATDIAGNARVLDGNGDCLARRDRGAYELTGFAAACPQGQQGATGGGTAAVPDTTKPTLARLAAGRTKLTFRLSEAARVSVTVERKGRKGRRTVYRRVGGFSVGQAKAGANSAKVPVKLAKKLKAPATYRVTLVATDAAGNRSAKGRKSFTVKPAKKKRRARR